MRITGNAYFLIGIMVIMLIIVGSALTMQYTSSKMLPLILGGTVFGLAGIGLANELLAQRKLGIAESASMADEEGERKKGGGEQWRGFLLNLAWLAGFVLGIHLLGFIIAIPLFLLPYMKWLGTRWLISIICAVLTPALIYAIFEAALGLPLYQGLVFRWLGYW